VGFDAFQWSIAVSLGGVGAQDRDGQKQVLLLPTVENAALAPS
jgi:hypothetical protein